MEDLDKRERIIATIHDQSHVGMNRTLDMTSSKYYWSGLTADVKEYVSNTTYNACINTIYPRIMLLGIVCI